MVLLLVATIFPSFGSVVFFPLGAKDFSYKKLFRFVSGALIGQTTPLVLELQCMNLVTALIWHTLLRALWVGDLMT